MLLTERGLRAATNRGDLRRAGITLYADARLSRVAARIMARQGRPDAAAQFIALAAHLQREAVAAFGGAA